MTTQTLTMTVTAPPLPPPPPPMAGTPFPPPPSVATTSLNMQRTVPVPPRLSSLTATKLPATTTTTTAAFVATLPATTAFATHSRSRSRSVLAVASLLIVAVALCHSPVSDSVRALLPFPVGIGSANVEATGDLFSYEGLVNSTRARVDVAFESTSMYFDLGLPVIPHLPLCDEIVREASRDAHDTLAQCWSRATSWFSSHSASAASAVSHKLSTVCSWAGDTHAMLYSMYQDSIASHLLTSTTGLFTLPDRHDVVSSLRALGALVRAPQNASVLLTEVVAWLPKARVTWDHTVATARSYIEKFAREVLRVATGALHKFAREALRVATGALRYAAWAARYVFRLCTFQSTPMSDWFFARATPIVIAYGRYPACLWTVFLIPVVEIALAVVFLSLLKVKAALTSAAAAARRSKVGQRAKKSS